MATRPTLEKLVNEYASARASRKIADAAMSAASEQIKDYMERNMPPDADGSKMYASRSGHTVTLSPKESKHTDMSKLMAKYPQAYIDCVTVTPTKQLTIR